jgi:putative proteasome-type protease
MTYCVGLLLDAGIVMLSDTRTSAGVDNIAVYRKLFAFENLGERAVVVMTSGNLSVTQTMLAKLQHMIDDPESGPEHSILKAETMLNVAEIVGRTLHGVGIEINERMSSMNQSATARVLLAGQRRGGHMRLFLVYPEGNFIEASPDTPYLQIGEHKYGKPILDRVITSATPLEEGRKAVLLSMDSTLRSNLSVGMPLDLAIIKRDDFRVSQERIHAGDPKFSAMSEAWSQVLREGFANMP